MEPSREPTAYLVTPRRVADRDRAAIERIYDAHYADVYRYALALTRSHDEAEEIAAEVFVRVLASWNEEPPRPLPWLLLTARRIATDRWRRAARWLAVRARLGEAKPGDAGERGTEFWAWFDAVAAVLTDRQREALVLRYHDDLSDADIAAILGMSESGARSLVARALAALRAHPELM